jgi:plasmid stability protein
MKNITVSVDEETYRRARIRAAEQGTSVSRVVKEELTRYAAEPTDHEARAARLKKLFAEIAEKRKGVIPEPVDPDWRQKMYDERFDETKLGRRLRGEDV